MSKLWRLFFQSVAICLLLAFSRGVSKADSTVYVNRDYRVNESITADSTSRNGIFNRGTGGMVVGDTIYITARGYDNSSRNRTVRGEGAFTLSLGINSFAVSVAPLTVRTIDTKYSYEVDYGRYPDYRTTRSTITTVTTTTTYYSGGSKTLYVNVGKGDQTITFGNPGTRFFGDPDIALSASSSSGLTVTYSVLSGPAIVNGSLLILTGLGDVTIRASQAGDGNINTAPPVDQTFSVIKKTQAIAFPIPTTPVFTGTPIVIELAATSSSGLPITYSNLTGPATLSGNTLTITGAGRVSIQATQPGTP